MLEQCQTQLTTQRQELERLRCKVHEQSSTAKQLSSQLAQQEKSLEERAEQKAHIDERCRQVQRLELGLEEQQHEVNNQWHAIKAQQQELAQQESELREGELVLQEQQQNAYYSANRYTELEKELVNLKAQCSFIEEQRRKAQELQRRAEEALHVIQKQQVQVGDQQHKLQTQSRISGTQADGVYDSLGQLKLLTEPRSEARGFVLAQRENDSYTSSDAESSKDNQCSAFKLARNVSATETQQSPTLPVASEQQRLQQVDSQELVYYRTGDHGGGASKAASTAEDEPVHPRRYTEFDFTNVLVQEETIDSTEETSGSTMLHTGASSALDSNYAELATLDPHMRLSQAVTTSSPIQINLEMRGADGKYKLSKTVHADLSDPRPARSMVIKHLRKGTAMTMQNERGQLVNANNFHVGMSTTEVNILRFVPRQPVLGDGSRETRTEGSDPTDRLARKRAAI